MADFAGERTEEATPRRRQEARRKGTVTKSQELTNALVLVGIMGVLPFVVSSLGKSMTSMIGRGFANIPSTASAGDIGNFTWNLLGPVASAVLPLLAAAVIIGVGVNFAQVGFVLSTETLNPTLSKLNPLNGLKRMFSMAAGVEGIKAILKTALFGYLAFSVVRERWPELAHLSYTASANSLAIIGDIIRVILLRVSIAWLALAAFDYLFQRYQVEKQLKMTKDELKQEFRQNEQSPELRMAMSQRRRKLLKGRVNQAVKGADVVITNPTHFSIALKYDKGQMHAPQVVAKGADHLAMRIRELAKESNVPIVPNPPLARQLYKKCEVGDYVPRELFQAVAEVLAYVYATLRKVRSGS